VDAKKNLSSLLTKFKKKSFPAPQAKAIGLTAMDAEFGMRYYFPTHTGALSKEEKWKYGFTQARREINRRKKTGYDVYKSDVLRGRFVECLEKGEVGPAWWQRMQAGMGNMAGVVNGWKEVGISGGEKLNNNLEVFESNYDESGEEI
jgi:hypothetical protein